MNLSKNFYYNYTSHDEFWHSNFGLVSELIYGKCCRFFDRHIAQDRCAEVIEKLLKKDFNYLRERKNHIAFTLTVARNHCINKLDKSKRTPCENALDLSNVKTILSDYNLESEEALELIYKNLLSLSTIQYEALKLQIEGYSRKEIAKILEVTESAVKGRLERAKINIQNMLDYNNFLGH